MTSNKKYWKSVEELEDNSLVEALKQNEFAEEIPVDEFLGDKESLESSSTSRRDFLKYVGFSTAAATLAACEGPVNKSIPYVVQPDAIIPGVADYYATTIADGFDFASVLVKTREGRPIKIEPNRESSLGNVNARVQASILSLYDRNRLKAPLSNNQIVSWSKFDTDTLVKINEAVANGKQIAFLTQTFASPSTSKLINSFKDKFANTTHVVYDAVSDSAAADAFEAKYKTRGLVNYDLSKADVIFSVAADFLGDWQGGGFGKGYSKTRNPKNGKMSYHVQLESNMSLSGASADLRIPSNSAEQKKAIATIYSAIVNGASAGKLDALVSRIKKAGSKAVVVSGLDDVDAQTLVLAINDHLKSEAFNTIEPILTRQGNNASVAKLLSNIKNNKVGVLIMSGVNPVYTLANSKEFVDALKNTTSISFSDRLDETAKVSNFVGAQSNYLESWLDVEMVKGTVAFTQPTIKKLFDSRQFQEQLMSWLGDSSSYNDYLKSTYSNVSFNSALHDGFVKMSSKAVETTEEASEENQVVDLSSSVSKLMNSKSSGYELVLYTKTGIGSGLQANNPWLQEFPDPITRASWDNYITMSKADADEKGVINKNVANGGLNGSYATIAVNGKNITLPVIIQPGQAKGTIGVALGYGRKEGLKQEMQTGKNAYSLYKDFNSVQNISSINVESGEHEFACVQLHNTLMGRGDIVKETTLSTYLNGKAKDWNKKPMVSRDHEMIPASSPEADLWTTFDRSIGHHFNLSIDLNSCTGCGACVVACHAENNVPVVGKSEMRRSRDMHWLRIDRYYSSQDTFEGDNSKKDNFNGLFGENGSLGGFLDMENPADNPQVVFQPVMCQHCNHAPCETVCPVAATSHGRQGQNHMAYNRCVGTRYCANNCPYKVRRFNWFLYNQNDEFDYHMNDDLGRMVLNPDVVVRSRGVMEKCSMCIQKTQKTILDAKREGRKVRKDEFKTACSSACETGAMAFGDINDKSSEIYQKKNDTRAYHLLESVGTKPNVVYQVKVRNS